MGILEQLLLGVIFGIIAGPLILFAMGMLIFKVRERSMEKEFSKMYDAHKKRIESLSKQHEKLQKKYTKEQSKLRRIVFTGD